MRTVQKLFVFIILLELLSVTVSAQNWDRYEPIVFSGEIPKEFLQRTSDKFLKMRDSLATSGTSLERRSKEDFLLQSSFAIDELMLSGKVLFNDPITDYLNQVKDYLLRDEPDLKDKIRIYAVKTPVVNAFATTEGNVFFTLGLLSRVSNEAEIAFVLCHEFQHFIHQHPMEGYVAKDKIMQGVNWLDNDQVENALLKRSVFSREQEMDADNLGRELFMKSGYSLDAVIGLFDIMQYDYLPMGNVPFDPAWLVSGPFAIPPDAIPDKVNPISEEYVYDSTRSTHPSIPQRREIVKQAILDNPDRGGEEVVIGDGRFVKFRTMARFEVAQMYLESREYEDALYQVYLLEREYPNSYFLKKTAAWALYGLAKYKNAREFFQVHSDAESAEGESMQLLNIMEELDRDELCLIAIRKAWEVHLLDRDNREVNEMLADLLREWWQFHADRAESLSSAQMPEDYLKAKTKKTKEIPADVGPDAIVRGPADAVWRASLDGKRDTLRALPTPVGLGTWKKTAAEEEEEKDSTDYFRYALSDLFAKAEFMEVYEKDKGNAAEEEEELTSSERDMYYRKRLRRGRALGLDKVIFVDPRYKRVDNRNRIAVDYLASETKLEEFHQQIRESAYAVGLKHDILSVQDMGSNDIESFNDLVTLRSWLSERFNHDEVDMVNMYMDETALLKEKYGTPNFCWLGAISVTDHRSTYSVLGPCLYGCIFPPVIILSLYKAVTPERNGIYYTYTIDVETNEKLDSEWREIKVKDTPALWKSTTYNTVLQMKTR